MVDVILQNWRMTVHMERLVMHQCMHLRWWVHWYEYNCNVRMWICLHTLCFYLLNLTASRLETWLPLHHQPKATGNGCEQQRLFPICYMTWLFSRISRRAEEDRKPVWLVLELLGTEIKLTFACKAWSSGLECSQKWRVREIVDSWHHDHERSLEHFDITLHYEVNCHIIYYNVHMSLSSMCFAPFSTISCSCRTAPTSPSHWHADL